MTILGIVVLCNSTLVIIITKRALANLRFDDVSRAIGGGMRRRAVRAALADRLAAGLRSMCRSMCLECRMIRRGFCVHPLIVRGRKT